LATRAIYERHLKSNLHRKRTQQQNELEAAAETLVPLPELSTHNFSNTSKAPPGDDAIDPTLAGGGKSMKFRSRSKVTCEECDMKLPIHLLGKHLISHFHYRKMLNNPRHSFAVVLNNFDKIILQSPFQCQPCRFYFNTQEEFLRHWHSTGHVECVTRRESATFLCECCKFQCAENRDMTTHLGGDEHQQVVAMINRSQPIVIRLLTLQNCGNCSQTFRYNVQLMRHLKVCQLKLAEAFSFAADGGGNACSKCSKVFQSALSLQKHKAKLHGISIFFCSDCKVTFKTALQAKAHRSTTQHKTISSRKKLAANPELGERLKKICSVCQQEMSDIIALKEHILQQHPEHKYR